MDFKFDSNVCPKCQIGLRDEFQKDRANSFKSFCDNCNFKKFICYCPECEAKIESTSSTAYVDGLPIKCTSPKCGISFQAVKCPYNGCEKYNYYSNAKYKMGQLIGCMHCKSNFQHLTCPRCLASNFWAGDKDSSYKTGSVISCYNCQEKIQHVLCPHCHESKYFNDCDYISGSKQRCDQCKKSFQHINCGSCSSANYYPHCNLQYGVDQICMKETCRESFAILACPHCGTEKVRKGTKAPYNIVDRDEVCNTCNRHFFCFSCNMCREPTYLDFKNDIKEEENRFNCLSCKKGIYLLYKCQTCKKVSLSSDCCQVCPPKVKEKPKKVEHNEKEKNCALCLDKPPEMALIPCGHKKTCEACTLKLKNCPFCRKGINGALKVYD